MHFLVLFADYPAGTLTGMYILLPTLALVFLCLFIAWTLRGTESRRVVCGWLIAAGVCFAFGVFTTILVSRLGRDLP